MNIFKLSLRNMTNRPLNTTLSAVLLALGVGIITLLMQANRFIEEQLESNIHGIDMVVGAKGSPLQLILSAVYHIDAPTGNISLKDAEKLKRNRLVAQGIPLSFGDSHKGFRIVGTNTDYAMLYEAQLKQGRFWSKPLEVTLGASVAADLGLQIGDSFAGSHGLSEGGEVHEGHAYEVVGILERNHTVIDQLILTSTESVWAVHQSHEDHAHRQVHAHDDHNHRDHSHKDHRDEDHVHHHNDHGHESSAMPERLAQIDTPIDRSHEKPEQKITAMLIKFRNPMGIMQVPRMVNEKTNMQAAVPAVEISRLFNLMGAGVEVLRGIALLIMLVSGLSVFISLFSALKERQYELAVMRTYGATRWQLVWMILQEGLIITAIGFALGILFSRIGLWSVSKFMESDYHYHFSGWGWTMEETWLLITSLSIGLLAAFIPAWRVYQINISKTLSNA